MDRIKIEDMAVQQRFRSRFLVAARLIGEDG
jgi:hypothetical protein